MTVDRICCVNPRCGRTAPADRHGESTDIICRGCSKQIPKAMANRFRTLRRRDSQLCRLINKRFAAGTMPQYRINLLGNLIDGEVQKNWNAIRAYFSDPEKPEGLETFLADIGIDGQGAA